jgi:hypothetical protein
MAESENLQRPKQNREAVMVLMGWLGFLAVVVAVVAAALVFSGDNGSIESKSKAAATSNTLAR